MAGDEDKGPTYSDLKAMVEEKDVQIDALYRRIDDDLKDRALRYALQHNPTATAAADVVECAVVFEAYLAGRKDDA